MQPTFYDIAARHAALYPKSQSQDYFKLAYQHAYGPGHLIQDESAARSFLADEASAAQSGPACARLYEPIGNGLCRLHLNASAYSSCALNLYAAMFLATARRPAEHPESLLSSALQALRSLAVQGRLSIPDSEFRPALDAYIASGCPPVRHSDAYRAAYHPHYRVIRIAYLEYFDALRLAGTCPDGSILAIDGRCAAGKTTLSSLISELFCCNVIHMDSFFLPPELRTPERLSHPGENVHHERFLEEVLLPLSRHQQISYQPFDCQTNALMPPVRLPERPLTVVEGTYSLHPRLRPYYNRSVFLTCRPEIQLSRLSKRETPDSFARFQSRWIPLEEAYFSALYPQSFCDLTLDTSDFLE